MTKPTGRQRGRPKNERPTSEAPAFSNVSASEKPGAELPGTVEELLPAPDREEVPDVQAAVASLTPPPAKPAEPVVGAIEWKERLAAAGAPPGHTAPVETPTPGRWSDRKIQRSNRKELRSHVRELEAELATLRPLGGPPAGEGEPGVSPVQELEELFQIVVPAISAVLEYTIGPEMKVDATETRVLVKTGAPAAVPYFAKARAAAPLLPFLVTLVAVFGPKAVAVAKSKQKQREAASLTPAPIEERPRPSAIPAPEPASAVRDRFGGPES